MQRLSAKWLIFQSKEAGTILVGFKPQPDPTSTTETVSGYLASITGMYDAGNVWVYNNAGGKWVRMQRTKTLSPGQAMWVLMTSPATLRPQPSPVLFVVTAPDCVCAHELI